MQTPSRTAGGGAGTGGVFLQIMNVTYIFISAESFIQETFDYVGVYLPILLALRSCILSEL